MSAQHGDQVQPDDQAPTPAGTEETADQGYRVGYMRPPQHTRFQPGRSGNPRGRPRSRKNLKTMAREVLQQPVVLMDKGRRRTVTALQAAMQKVLGRALRDGEPRALAIVLALADRAGLADEITPESADGLSAEEREVLEVFKASLEPRIVASSRGEDEP